MSNKKILTPFYHDDKNIIEIGIDEAGRGPLFGRVYCAGVVFPNDVELDFSQIKDSKKFTSEKKINEVYDWIKENALYYNVSYNDEKTIDKINIRQATINAMHKCVENIVENHNMNATEKNIHLLVDGNDFIDYTYINNNMLYTIDHTCIKGGDDKYVSIAAASILAKVERDRYIEELCNENDDLSTKYDIKNNKGYGTKKHIEAIKQYGISEYHRKTYGICKNYS